MDIILIVFWDCMEGRLFFREINDPITEDEKVIIDYAIPEVQLSLRS